MRTILALALLFGISALSPSQAQVSDAGNTTLDSSKNFQFIPIPYLSYNRSVGFTYGLLPIAMYKVNKKDTISPASISGLYAIGTTNDTWLVGGFQRLYVREDKWRFTGAFGVGELNFQFLLDGWISAYIPYTTSFDFAYIDIQRRISDHWFIGLQYTYVFYETQISELPFNSVTTMNGVGLVSTYENRDDVYYPRKGGYSEIMTTHYPDLLGNETDGSLIDLDYNHFLPFREKDILGVRAYAGIGIGDLPFEQQYFVGGDDLRGYTQGAYRGQSVLAAQLEYRWNFAKRHSLVGFGGIATVLEPVNEAHRGLALPAIGAGYRFTAFVDYHLNVGLDVAVGRDDWGVYFRIGEAF
jgi:hypothetical protein